jgi:oligogalacturonide lyase
MQSTIRNTIKRIFLKCVKMRPSYAIGLLIFVSYPTAGADVVRDAEEFRVTRLTQESDEINEVLYLTNNGFTRDEKGLVFDKRIGKRWQLMFCDLSTYEIIPLPEIEKLRERGAVVASKTNEIFYSTNTELHLFNLDSKKDSRIWTAPSGFSFSPISTLANGDAVAFSLQEKISLETRTEVLHSESKEKFMKKPLGIIMTGTREKGIWTFREVLRENASMNHTQINTVDGKTILYSHEGPAELLEQRMWLVDSDGKNKRPLRKESPEDRITHEFWLEDGLHIGYQSYQKNGHIFGLVDLTHENEKHEFWFPEKSTHNFAKFMNNGDIMIMGDGSNKYPYIHFYFVRANSGKTEKSVRVIKVNRNTSQEYWHQHARFSPSGRFMVYGSANDKKGGDVYIIDRIPK